jgi:hypothetical protein
MKDRWRKVAIISLLLTGTCFTLFPLLRPFFNESSVQEAAGFASNNWVIAHTFGMGGFIFLSLSMLGIYIFSSPHKYESLAGWSVLIVWIGTGLTLPFFGAEALSLPVIASEALKKNSRATLQLIDAVRFGPGFIFIILGLFLIVISSVIFAWFIWISEKLPKWSGIYLAIGLLIYIPTLRGDSAFQTLRIADGLLILISCFWIASYLAKKRN